LEPTLDDGSLHEYGEEDQDEWDGQGVEQGRLHAADDTPTAGRRRGSAERLEGAENPLLDPAHSCWNRAPRPGGARWKRPSRTCTPYAHLRSCKLLNPNKEKLLELTPNGRPCLEKRSRAKFA